MWSINLPYSEILTMSVLKSADILRNYLLIKKFLIHMSHSLGLILGVHLYHRPLYLLMAPPHYMHFVYIAKVRPIDFRGSRHE